MPYDENGSLSLPTDILHEFEPWMYDAMREAGQNGGTRNELILATGLSKRRFNAFITPGGPDYLEAFEDAYQLASMYSQSYWEAIGRRASNGKIVGHASSTYKLMITNNFKKDYADTQVVEHKGNVTPTISKDLTPVEASQQYKQLLLESSVDDFFD